MEIFNLSITDDDQINLSVAVLNFSNRKRPKKFIGDVTILSVPMQTCLIISCTNDFLECYYEVPEEKFLSFSSS